MPSVLPPASVPPIGAVGVVVVVGVGVPGSPSSRGPRGPWSVITTPGSPCPVPPPPPPWARRTPRGCRRPGGRRAGCRRRSVAATAAAAAALARGVTGHGAEVLGGLLEVGVELGERDAGGLLTLGALPVVLRLLQAAARVHEPLQVGLGLVGVGGDRRKRVVVGLRGDEPGLAVVQGAGGGRHLRRRASSPSAAPRGSAPPPPCRWGCWGRSWSPAGRPGRRGRWRPR